MAYTISFADPTKTPFPVDRFDVNGPLAPSVTEGSVPPVGATIGGITASSQSTSLIVVGQGVAAYGDAVFNNMVFMLEHFANKYPPTNPVEGQLWYRNTADPHASSVDPTEPTPPLNAMYMRMDGVADEYRWARVLHLNATGGVDSFAMGGNTIMGLGAPVNPTDAATKLYADGVLGSHVTDLTLHLTPTQNTNLDLVETQLVYLADVTSSIQAQLNARLQLSGGTLLGPLTLAADPASALQAATKQYVDDSITSTGGSDVIALSWDGGAETLTLTQGGLPNTIDVTIPIIAAGAVYDIDPAINQSDVTARERDTIDPLPLGPSIPLQETLQHLDQAAYQQRRGLARTIREFPHSGIEITTPITLIGSNRLTCRLQERPLLFNGHGSADVVMPHPIGTEPRGANSLSGLATGSYSFDIALDGGSPVTITVAITAPATVATVIGAIQNELVAAFGGPLGYGVDINLVETNDEIVLRFISRRAGPAVLPATHPTTTAAAATRTIDVVVDGVSSTLSVAVSPGQDYHDIATQMMDPSNQSVVVPSLVVEVASGHSFLFYTTTTTSAAGLTVSPGAVNDLFVYLGTADGSNYYNTRSSGIFFGNDTVAATSHRVVMYAAVPKSAIPAGSYHITRINDAGVSTTHTIPVAAATDYLSITTSINTVAGFAAWSPSRGFVFTSSATQTYDGAPNPLFAALTAADDVTFHTSRYPSAALAITTMTPVLAPSMVTVSAPTLFTAIEPTTTILNGPPQNKVHDLRLLGESTYYPETGEYSTRIEMVAPLWSGSSVEVTRAFNGGFI